MRDKRYYEEIIEQTTLFGLDPEKEPAAYKQEKNRLPGLIFLWGKSYTNRYYNKSASGVWMHFCL